MFFLGLLRPSLIIELLNFLYSWYTASTSLTVNTTSSPLKNNIQEANARLLNYFLSFSQKPISPLIIIQWPPGNKTSPKLRERGAVHRDPSARRARSWKPYRFLLALGRHSRQLPSARMKISMIRKWYTRGTDPLPNRQRTHSLLNKYFKKKIKKKMTHFQNCSQKHN
jgi:hypothetical protein